MSDSGENFFRADKANRNAAFRFANGTGTPELDGDQAARVHPFPQSLPPTQKVGDTHQEAGYDYPPARAAGDYA